MADVRDLHEDSNSEVRPLPFGWKRAKLAEIAMINMGQSPPGKTYNRKGMGLPFFQGKADFGERFPSVRAWCTAPRKIAHPRDILLSVRAPVGPTNIASCTCAIGRGLAGITPQDGMVSEYIWFALRNSEQELALRGTGSTFTAISKKTIEEIEIDTPPLQEQKRIVAKLEELLPRVNAVKERLVRVKEIMKRFRQSVLAAACSGRLTQEWRGATAIAESAEKLVKRILSERTRILRHTRNLNGKGQKISKGQPFKQPSPEFETHVPESWTILSMDALTDHITSGSRGWKPYYRDEGPGTFIMGQNVRPFRLDLSRRIAVDPPEDDPDRRRSEVSEGDLLVTIAGNTGEVCRVSEPLKEHYVCQSVALMRPVLPQMAPFLELYLNSPLHGQSQFGKRVYGEGRPHLSFDHLRSLCVLVPPLEEQKEILRRVGSLFNLAERIDKRIEAELSRTEKMTQAILAKAFRAELVPQGVSD